MSQGLNAAQQMVLLTFVRPVHHAIVVFLGRAKEDALPGEDKQPTKRRR